MSLFPALLCGILALASWDEGQDIATLPPLTPAIEGEQPAAQPFSASPDVFTQFPNPGQGQPVVPPTAPPCSVCVDEAGPDVLIDHPQLRKLEVWGVVGFYGIFAGSRMAPNGVPFDPLFDVIGQLNIGLLPNKKLYIFTTSDFWGQKAGPGVTNASQGSLDFSKREWDTTGGIAWNYYGALELRVFGFANSNLNRGTSLAFPIGFNDGFEIENRYYLPSVDPYDVGKQGFLSIGYVPNGELVGNNGEIFKTGLMARAYLTHDLPIIRSYLYLDAQLEAEKFTPRLLLFEKGLAVRPWLQFQNLEFRVGASGVYDIKVNQDRILGYLGIRLQF